jgi:hypothetical protein
MVFPMPPRVPANDAEEAVAADGSEVAEAVSVACCGFAGKLCAATPGATAKTTIITEILASRLVKVAKDSVSPGRTIVVIGFSASGVSTFSVLDSRS